jgi:hypothetical protein
MSLTKSDKFGDDVKLWIGQIVEDSTWNDNETREKWTNQSDIKGWGSRYKVRILSQHSESKNTVSDENLPMVDVMYPVTGGSGHGASFQSSNLRKGSFVIGFYRDGINRSEPIIIGTLGNNDQTALQFKNPDKGFIPRSGLNNERVPGYSIPANGSSGQGGVSGQPAEGVGAYCTWESLSDAESKKRGEETSDLKSTHKCDPSELKGIQLEIVNLIKRIESIRKRITNWQNSVSDFTNSIKREIERAAKFISKVIKNVIERIRTYVTDKVTNLINDLYNLLTGNRRSGPALATNKALDQINCLFDKIIDKLLSMILDFLLQIVDRYINAPLCAIQKFLEKMLGELFGFIMGAIESIIAPLSSIFGIALSIADTLIGFFKQLFSLFSCEPDPDCPEIKQWSTWNGAGNNGGNFDFDVNSILDDIKSVANQVKDTFNVDNYDFNIDFSAAVQSSIDGCGVGPILCGPPKVEFFGGGGFGAAGNVIIGTAGDILGIDMTNFGSGYTSAPFAKIVDSCGKGRGAVLKPVVGYVKKPENPEDPEESPFNDNNILIDQNTGTIISVGISPDNDPVVPINDTTLGGDTDLPRSCSDFCPEEPLIKYELDTFSKKIINSRNIGVTGVIVLKSGTGYLNSPDGSLGGEGRVWAEKNQTVIRRSDGRYDPPYYPGQLVKVNPCDEVLLPYSDGFKSCGETDYITPDPENPENPENPKDPNNYIPTKNPPSIIPNFPVTTEISTLPTRKPAAYPTNSNDEYEVIMYLCDVYISNPGINYSQTDKIIVTPNNGAELEPVFGSFGKLEKIKIQNSGSGFTSRPIITIQTETGYNAEIVPVFCVNRIGDLDVEDEVLPDPSKILKVVDCVGKN